MKATVIYKDNDIQIVEYDDDDQQGDTFGIYENAIDVEKGGQQELMHVKLDRNYFNCVEDVKGALIEAVKYSRDIINLRRERGKIVPLND